MYQAFSRYLNIRLVIMLALGFSSGLPLALTGSTIQAWFTESGVSLMAIGALTLVGIPYLLKFLWAPLMDRFSLPWLDRRRGWISSLQISLAVIIFLLSYFNPQTDALIIGFLVLIIAFLSASQDIAIDAYRTEILEPQERGLGSAYFIFAYRMAMLVSGGLALIAADYFGWQFTYKIIAACMAVLVFSVYIAPHTVKIATGAQSFSLGMIEPFKNLLLRNDIIWILSFVVLYKVGAALALSLMSNFLLRGLGFSLTEIGIAYKTISMIGTLIGALLGGILLMRWSLYACLLAFGTAQAISTLLFAVLALVGKNYGLMVFSLFIENFCSGMSAAAFLAFLMSLCQREYAATQFAVLSALDSLGRVLLGPVAGAMVLHIGWVSFFLWSFMFSIPGLLLLMIKRNQVMHYAPAK